MRSCDGKEPWKTLDRMESDLTSHIPFWKLWKSTFPARPCCIFLVLLFKLVLVFNTTWCSPITRALMSGLQSKFFYFFGAVNVMWWVARDIESLRESSARHETKCGRRSAYLAAQISIFRCRQRCPWNLLFICWIPVCLTSLWNEPAGSFTLSSLRYYCFMMPRINIGFLWRWKH